MPVRREAHFEGEIAQVFFAFFDGLAGGVGDFVTKIQAGRIDRFDDAHIGELRAAPRLVFAGQIDVGKRDHEFLSGGQGFIGALDDGLPEAFEDGVAALLGAELGIFYIGKLFRLFKNNVRAGRGLGHFRGAKRQRSRQSEQNQCVAG